MQLVRRLGVACIVVAIFAPSGARSGSDSKFLAVDFFIGGGVWVGDVDNGQANQIGYAGFSPLNSLARSPEGVFYSAARDGDTDQLITIDPQTGAGTFVADMEFGTGQNGVRAMAFSPAGELFAVRAGVPSLLFRVDVVTGAVIFVGSMTGFSSIQSLEFSPSGTLYAWDLAQGLLVIDPQTAAATDVDPSIHGNGDIQTIAFEPSGQLWGMGLNTWTIDTETGLHAMVHDGYWFQFRGAGFLEDPPAPDPSPDPTPVPSTSTFGLLILVVALATAGEIALRRRSGRSTGAK